MKKIIIILIICTSAFAAHAQKDSIRVSAKVGDAFTGSIIEDGEVEVLMPDSSLVSRGRWVYNVDNGVRTASSISCRVPKAGKYIFKLTHPNYFTLCHTVDVKRPRRGGTFVSLNEKIWMRKRPKVTQLNEVTVRATKIKMVMRGDTIVYDADAFQLSQGSMLDALIEQLPGAELKTNGMITVNGKPVSSLLVNGKDFFRGDPRIALENLPAYMVDKVKVYEKQTDFERITGQDELMRPIVMDVNLKKQYSVGWIANAEVAYGTKNTYLGRLFAMRFTDCSRLALFGNFNNTNDTRRPGQRGDWTPSYLPDGIRTSQNAGGEFFYENRHKTFEWTSNLDFSHADHHILTQTSEERFLPTDRSYSQSRGDELYRTTSLKTTHRFKSKKKATHSGNIAFNYDNNTYFLEHLSGEFDDNPYSHISNGVLDSLFLPDAGTLRELARYRRRQEEYRRGENWSIAVPYNLMWTPFESSGIMDMINLDLSGTYDRHTSHSFDNYFLEYLGADAPPDDYRNRYTAKPSQHYNYNARLAYHMFLKSLWPTLSYRYSQDYTSGRKDLYRLDRIEGWGKDTEHELGTLPSSSSEMQHALDMQNSEHSEQWKGKHQIELKLEYRIRKKHQTTFVLALPVHFEQDRLLYDRSGRHYDLHRTKALFVPSGSIQQVFMQPNNYMTSMRLNYSLSRHQPDLVRTIELIDDSNPLYVYKGNAQLSATTVNLLTLNVDVYRKYRQLYNFDFSYRHTGNALATERTFNPITGGYTVRPVNVDGNWRINGSLSLNRQFGKQREFAWSTNTSWSYDHNVDMANVEGATVNGLSTIKNLYLREQLTLDYSRNGWNIGTKVRVSYNRLTGNRSDFTNINAWDYNYGINARVPLPWGIGLTTDFTVFSRRGYESPLLNTDNLVWNIRLERSILNGNLTFAVDGFDLLHDLAKVTSIMNAQGRTESYSNVLPSYFMGHVMYRFNKQPKNKRK